ncbi:hypothetical protein [Nocardioides sp. B-3]|uniref:hypothetical protein n=1 Tax=Nocardioides sp. B-3 TaxID=2895565 RepID=UPI0021522782|nr:hypothetical protein [Nocardioides sp. B-3]UUZ60265.1 hypothetical protein LP418_04860 [Nocardioides sp. B-3]
MNHIAHHPRDVLRCRPRCRRSPSPASPTSSRRRGTRSTDLLRRTATTGGTSRCSPSPGRTRGRFDEAGLLAESALFCEPSSGHAVHAQTHVMYETGKHESGRVWLDHWVAESGRSASHRAHFSWHAALHDLALGDTEAVRQRYYSQLAPPTVTGVRALVDSASLLWRWRVTTSSWSGSSSSLSLQAAPPPVECVLEAAGARPDRPAGDAFRGDALGARPRGGRRPRPAGRAPIVVCRLLGPHDVGDRGRALLGG